jgi:hypothetical protein
VRGTTSITEHSLSTETWGAYGIWIIGSEYEWTGWKYLSFILSCLYQHQVVSRCVGSDQRSACNSDHPTRRERAEKGPTRTASFDRTWAVEQSSKLALVTTTRAVQTQTISYSKGPSILRRRAAEGLVFHSSRQGDSPRTTSVSSRQCTSEIWSHSAAAAIA